MYENDLYLKCWQILTWHKYIELNFLANCLSSSVLFSSIVFISSTYVELKINMYKSICTTHIISMWSSHTEFDKLWYQRNKLKCWMLRLTREVVCILVVGYTNNHYCFFSTSCQKFTIFFQFRIQNKPQSHNCYEIVLSLYLFIVSGRKFICVSSVQVYPLLIVTVSIIQSNYLCMSCNSASLAGRDWKTNCKIIIYIHHCITQ